MKRPESPDQKAREEKGPTVDPEGPQARRPDQTSGLTRRALLMRTGSYSAAVVGLVAAGRGGGGCGGGVRDCYGDPDCLCQDTCYWSADDECDDGEIGSDYSACSLGTDCTDCGIRYLDQAYSDYSDYSDYSNYADYSNTYSDYSNSYSNYSNNYYDYYSNYYNYFVNSW